MQSNLFRLNWKDLGKGLVVAVLVVVLGSLQQAFMEHGLDVAAFDWAAILDVAWKAMTAYMFKNLLSDGSGRVFGRLG